MTFNHLTPFRALAHNAGKLTSTLRWFIAALAFVGFCNSAWAGPALPAAGDTTISAIICANETYAFNGQQLQTPGIYTAIYEAADGSDSTVTLILQVRAVSESNLTASICQGEAYSFNGSQYTQSGVYSATLTGANGCDSIARLRLTVFPTALTKLKVGICSGSAYVFQGDTLKNAGLYSVILNTVHGCDSIVQLQLEVVPFFNIPLSASICKGETYLFGGDLLSNAGVYTQTLKAIGGCDSIVTLTLNVLPVPLTNLAVGICTGTFYLYQGDLLGANGVYTYAFSAANGCDSIVKLNLQVVNSFETTASATICEGETYAFGNLELSATGVYTHVFTAIGGCDSTVILTLNILPTKTKTLQVNICDGASYEYQGTILTEPGFYKFVLEAANGCDSTVFLTLDVLPVPNTVLQASICFGESYNFNGEILVVDGVYEQTYTAASGCDSIVSLILIVLPFNSTELYVTVCHGETYDFNGETLDSSGIYSQDLVAENGCDSSVYLILKVLPVLESSWSVSICAGDSLEFDGQQLTDAGTYTAILAGTNDCDSTVTLNLEVLPTESTNLEISICADDSYEFDGEALTDAGTYTAVYTSLNGCDSTVTLVLTVLPYKTTQIPVAICEGETYVYFGNTFNVAGSYEFVFAAANGCDSTVIIQLRVLPTSHTAVEATICKGAAYDFYGTSLTQSGDYDKVFDAANGCDSIVTLHLTVLSLPFANLSVAICSGLSYEFNGQLLTDSGTYTSVAPGANGCDSTTILDLTFVMEFETHLEASICMGQTYEFSGQMLNTAGVYQDTLTAAGGCDSLVILSLNILPLSQSLQNVTICAGAHYFFDGQFLTNSGTYTVTLSGVNGCDSMAVLNLTVLPVKNTPLDITTCANEPYLFNGLSLGQSGNYTAVLTGLNGCDSTVMLHLTVLPVVSKSINVTTCANEGYVFDGALLTQTGTYSATYQAANGCDSLLTLQLTVLPTAQSGTAAVVCEGQPFEYNGEVLTQSGAYAFNFPGAAANGCDSVETLFLTIFPLIPVTQTSVTLCNGGTYLFDGQILTASGTYTAELSSATGCDSVVVLDLTIFPASGLTINATICEGEGYDFQGQLVTQAGNYTVTYKDVNGCDSVVLLILAVNVVNTNVTLQGGTLTAQTPNGQYQWINCATNQPIAGATDSSFTPTATGQYAVQITDFNGCSGQSDCQLVQIVSVGEPWSQADWSLQPNPATQVASVMLHEALEGALQVEVYDPAGRLLRQLEVAPGTRQILLDLMDFPEGMLLVRLLSERGTSAKMLMKAGR